jgi:hypothetical protein
MADPDPDSLAAATSTLVVQKFLLADKTRFLLDLLLHLFHAHFAVRDPLCDAPLLH